MNHIPDSHKDLLQDDARALAYLATIMPDGTPQVTPLWFNTDGSHILINSAKGRVKDRNMRLRPQVAIVIQDRKIDTRYVQVRGRVAEITEEGALDHIDQLSMKYKQKHWTPTAGQTRVIYKILPEAVFADE